MTRAASLAAVLALVATPALPLSCLKPDVVRMYEEVRDSENSFWLARGRIEPLEPVAWPKRGPDGIYPNDAEASTRVRLTGLGLRPDGTYAPFAQDITMTISCVVSWCGSPPFDTEIYAAVELTEDGPELWIGACPWLAIPVGEGDDARLLACVRDGDCRTD